MTYCKTIFIFLLFYYVSVNNTYASAWIGIHDSALHNDVQTLVDYGYINTVSLTYPLPWKGIDNQLKNITVETMPSAARVAFIRLQHYLNQTVNRDSMQMAGIHLSSDEKRFTRFTNNEFEKARAFYSGELRSGPIAARVKVNLNEDGDSQVDGSYLAYTFSDWNVRVGMIDQWWGPGQSSSLILSNNARPIKTLALSRATATQSKTPWLSWLGPWYGTFQLGQLEKQRHIPNATLAMSRFNFAPFDNLEIGLSWVAMWGGDGIGKGLGRLIDVMTFKEVCADGSDNCDPSLNTKVGNHIAGYDIKYRFHLWDNPFSVYAQRIGEDAADYWRVTDSADLLGVSTYMWGAKLSLEWSDTNVRCNGADSPVTNCYYEHSEFRTGYRHRGRAIGSAYDSDTKAITLNVRKRFENGTSAEFSLSKVEMNLDGEKPAPVVKGASESFYRLNLSYQFPFNNWIFDADVDAFKGFDATDDNTVIVSSTAKWVF